MSLRRLVLWRHGETDFNVAGRIQGQLDIPLTPHGQYQAARAARVLAEFRPEVAVSSDLQRAWATAQAFTEVSGIPVEPDERLRETLLGQWQGLSGTEVEDDWPGAMDTWRTVPTWAPPGGESRVEVAKRALDLVQELDQEYSGTALLCTHGGAIRALTAGLLNLPLESWVGVGGIANCHWTVLEPCADDLDRWQVLVYNVSAE